MRPELEDTLAAPLAGSAAEKRRDATPGKA